MLLTYYLAKMYEKSGMLFYLITSYLSITLFCGCRFFVGNDYFSYYDGITYCQSFDTNFLLWEPSFYFLIYLFRDSPIAYFYVLFSCSIITYLFIFKSLTEKKCLAYGILFVFLLGYLIVANNIVRQGVAMSIFFYSIKYIESGKFWKYLICILFCASFHYSSIIFLSVYLIRYIHLGKYTWLFILLITFVIELTGITKGMVDVIYGIIPVYGERFLSKEDIYNVENTFGLGMLYNFIMGLFVVFYYDFKRPNNYVSLFLLGVTLMTLFYGLQVIERIAFYLFYLNMIVYAMLFKQMRKYNNCKYLCSFLLSCMFIYYGIQSLTGMEKQGAVPYRTIWGENMKNPQYNRAYEDKK